MKQSYFFPIFGLLISCQKENPDYDLGFEAGCALGTTHAEVCRSKNPKVDVLIEKDFDYADGFYTGYFDCYETAMALSTCDAWDSGY